MMARVGRVGRAGRATLPVLDGRKALLSREVVRSSSIAIVFTAWGICSGQGKRCSWGLCAGLSRGPVVVVG